MCFHPFQINFLTFYAKLIQNNWSMIWFIYKISEQRQTSIMTTLTNTDTFKIQKILQLSAANIIKLF